MALPGCGADGWGRALQGSPPTFSDDQSRGGRKPQQVAILPPEDAP
jgi:hypothetical protein